MVMSGLQEGKEGTTKIIDFLKDSDSPRNPQTVLVPPYCVAGILSMGIQMQDWMG